jgi:sodium-coupled neutral amino acid transporter 9
MDFRMRYYNALVNKMGAPTSINTLPEHLVPAELYHVQVDAGDEEAPGDGKQSSVMTVFSIWNTMMGSSLMALPWGFAKAGLLGGILMSLAVGLISWYTCWLILKIRQSHNDLFDLCQEYLGSPGRWISWIASILFGVGVIVSYNIIMTTSLVDSIEGFRDIANHDVVSSMTPYWNRYIAATIIAIFGFALSNFRHYGFLVKLNTWTIILLIYIIVFFLGSSFKQGIQSLHKTELFELSFGWFSGVLTASFVLHNAIINIMKNQRYPENNIRDLSIGYSLVVITYILVGSICFAAYRSSSLLIGHHGIIPQDFLQLFPRTNIGAIIARFALIIHLLLAFPLLCAIIRIQFFGMLWQSQFPGWLHVLSLNFVLVAIGTVFAMLWPHLADILRFLGATTGVVLVFILPTTLYFKKLRRESTGINIALQLAPAAILLLCGISMFVSQFL